MAEENKTYLTEEGLKKLQDEYYNLVHVVREEVKQELAEARAQGDLSENADYDAARDEQAKVEARISTLEYMLRNYELIDTKKAGKKSAVHIGSSVTLFFNDTKEEVTYNIVGSTESDPLNGRLSNETIRLAMFVKCVLQILIQLKLLRLSKESLRLQQIQ